MVLIKRFKIRKSKSIALPRLWLEENRIQPGDQIDVWADGEGRLIIVPPKRGGAK